jgi:SAM-dependent methyltransferase
MPVEPVLLDLFPQFQRIVAEFGDRVVAVGLYDDPFHHYVTDLNRGVTWDIDALAASLASPTRVLDVGTGNGRVGKALALLGHEVVGIDKGAWAGTHSRTIGYQYVQGDLRDADLDQVDGEFPHAVMSAGSLNAFAPRDLPELLDSLDAVLEPKGAFTTLVFRHDVARPMAELAPFQGTIFSHCVDRPGNSFVVWTAVRVDVAEHLLWHVCYAAGGEPFGHWLALNEDYLWSVDRLAQAAMKCGWRVATDGTSPIVGGAADGMEMQLVTLRRRA